MSASSIDASREEQRLYDLIYKRTLASQMADAKLDKTVAKISVSGRDEDFVARGEVITFEGFLKLTSRAQTTKTAQTKPPRTCFPP